MKYVGATFFVDHCTDRLYIHLMTNFSGEATLEAKHAYERLCGSEGVRVVRYHADNGRFAEDSFISDIRAKNQGITFCGVGSHHQNSIAEKKI